MPHLDRASSFFTQSLHLLYRERQLFAVLYEADAGISRAHALSLLLENPDRLRSLAERGWVRITAEQVHLSPLLRDTLAQAIWEEPAALLKTWKSSLRHAQQTLPQAGPQRMRALSHLQGAVEAVLRQPYWTYAAADTYWAALQAEWQATCTETLAWLALPVPLAPPLARKERDSWVQLRHLLTHAEATLLQGPPDPVYTHLMHLHAGRVPSQWHAPLEQALPSVPALWLTEGLPLAPLPDLKQVAPHPFARPFSLPKVAKPSEKDARPLFPPASSTTETATPPVLLTDKAALWQDFLTQELHLLAYLHARMPHTAPEVLTAAFFDLLQAYQDHLTVGPPTYSWQGSLWPEVWARSN